MLWTTAGLRRVVRRRPDRDNTPLKRNSPGWCLLPLSVGRDLRAAFEAGCKTRISGLLFAPVASSCLKRFSRFIPHSRPCINMSKYLTPRPVAEWLCPRDNIRCRFVINLASFVGQRHVHPCPRAPKIPNFDGEANLQIRKVRRRLGSGLISRAPLSSMP